MHGKCEAYLKIQNMNIGVLGMLQNNYYIFEIQPFEIAENNSISNFINVIANLVSNSDQISHYFTALLY